MRSVLFLIALVIAPCSLGADEPKCEVIMLSTEGCGACNYWDRFDKPLIPGAKVVKLRKYPTYILIVDGKVKVLEPPRYALEYRTAGSLKMLVEAMRKRSILIPTPIPDPVPNGN